ncbi:MAG: M16 family metallopeptidase [Candidatus Bipolaricaulia bacterium]
MQQAFEATQAEAQTYIEAEEFSRIYDEERLALSVNTGTTPADRYANLFFFHGVPRAPHMTEELERLKAEPVTEQELQKVKNRVRAGFIFSLQSNGGLAAQLAFFEAFFGSWERMLEYADIIESITTEEIMEVAQKFFIEENRTVATLVEEQG